MSHEQDNIEHFNQMARQWDEDPGRVRTAHTIAKAILEQLELGLEGNERALEFGCGTGLLTMQMAPHVGHITAMDTSQEMLNQLADKCQQQNVQNITPMQGNITEPLPDAGYDLIFCSMTLHHVENISHVVQNIYKHLNDNGQVAFADLDAEGGAFHGDQAGVTHHGFQRGEFEDMLAQAGLTKMQISTAHTIEKEGEDNQTREFTVFLATARKSGMTTEPSGFKL